MHFTSVNSCRLYTDPVPLQNSFGIAKNVKIPKEKFSFFQWCSTKLAIFSECYLGNSLQRYYLDWICRISGHLKQCLSSCEEFSFSIQTSSVQYPNEYAFPKRPDFCYIFRQIIRSCQNPWKKDSIKEWIKRRHYKNIGCSNLIDLHLKGSKICLDQDIIADHTEEDHPELVDIVSDYTKDNIAYVKFYIKNPFYTSITRDVPISVYSFIGNTGGFFGLCLGLSFMSICEIIYHILLALISVFCVIFNVWRINRKRSQLHQLYSKQLRSAWFLLQFEISELSQRFSYREKRGNSELLLKLCRSQFI